MCVSDEIKTSKLVTSLLTFAAMFTLWNFESTDNFAHTHSMRNVKIMANFKVEGEPPAMTLYPFQRRVIFEEERAHRYTGSHVKNTVSYDVISKGSTSLLVTLIFYIFIKVCTLMLIFLYSY